MRQAICQKVLPLMELSKPLYEIIIISIYFYVTQWILAYLNRLLKFQSYRTMKTEMVDRPSTHPYIQSTNWDQGIQKVFSTVTCHWFFIFYLHFSLANDNTFLKLIWNRLISRLCIFMRKTMPLLGFHATHTCSPSLAYPTIAFASQGERRIYVESFLYLSFILI